MQSPIKPRRSRRLEEKAAAAAFAKPNSSPNPAPTTPTSTKPKRSKRLNGKRVAVVFQLDTVYGGVKSNLPTRYLIAAVNAMQTMSSPENASSTIVTSADYAEAASDPDHGIEWIVTSEQEYQSMVENKVFKLTKIKDLSKGTRILSAWAVGVQGEVSS